MFLNPPIGNMTFNRTSPLPAHGCRASRGGVSEHDGLPKYHSAFHIVMVATKRSPRLSIFNNSIFNSKPARCCHHVEESGASTKKEGGSCSMPSRPSGEGLREARCPSISSMPFVSERNGGWSCATGGKIPPNTALCKASRDLPC